MAKAAKRLAISQPVVSKTIADLEHALGVRLLDRTSQGVEPTAYGRSFIHCGTADGRSFIHCGTAVFDEMRRGVRDIEFLADPTAGEVAAFDVSVEIWGVKYDKAVECLIKDRDVLLAFYDFPAAHWKHLRTTNVIESSFATVRHRTVRSKGCLSNKTALAMIFKLAEAAEKSWRRLDGHNQLPKVILGVKFTDGIEVARSQAQAAAA
jgi:hypothetical protein